MKPEDLARLFSSFQHSAFRMETLPAYQIEGEAQSLALWRAGEPEPEWRKDREWLALVRHNIAAGKFMQRVRVVRRPLSDYVRFELDWGYPANVKAGEDIRVWELGPGDELPYVPEPDRGYDFWCFDGVTVVRLEYDDEGRFIQPVDVSEYASRFIACQNYVMRRAMPFSDYRTRV